MLHGGDGRITEVAALDQGQAPHALQRADAFRYVNGLDGHYLAYRDPARFAVWLAAGAGAIDDPATPIAAAFDARFVVVARQHERLAEQLRRSPKAVLHLVSPEGSLFELRR